MDLHLLSKSYTVRKLDEADVDAIFELMRKNEIFYKYHPPFVTKESILINIILVSLKMRRLLQIWI